MVYAGFGALMLTTCISYLSHSQVEVTLKIDIPSKSLVLYQCVPLAFGSTRSNSVFFLVKFNL